MELLKIMLHYYDINKCYPGNDYWSKLFEFAVEKDKLSLPIEAGTMPKIAEIPKNKLLLETVFVNRNNKWECEYDNHCIDEPIPLQELEKGE